MVFETIVQDLIACGISPRGGHSQLYVTRLQVTGVSHVLIDGSKFFMHVDTLVIYY